MRATEFILSSRDVTWRATVVAAILLSAGCGTGSVVQSGPFWEPVEGIMQDEARVDCPASFVTGRGQVSRHEDLSVIEMRELPCLTGDGTLSGFLLASVSTTIDAEHRAFAEDHQFLFPPPDPRFDAVQVYYTLVHMTNWLTLSFAPDDTRLERLRSDTVHLDYGRSELGSRQVCRQLWLGMRRRADESVNTDVLVHEFGHHVVYALDRTISNQMLHEGLADYFAAAFTRDGIVGPSDCPASIGI